LTLFIVVIGIVSVCKNTTSKVFNSFGVTLDKIGSYNRNWKQ